MQTLKGNSHTQNGARLQGLREISVVTIFLLLCFVPSTQAYWQQHVRYDIRATLIDSIHTLDGNLTVVYTNHSSDTLHEIYFHLYANAFQPGSMMDERSHELHTNPIFDRIAHLSASEQGNYWIPSITCDNHPVTFTITGTIMRVDLASPLVPGDSVLIQMPFRERIPRQIRRSGWRSREGVEYSMAQWYPKIAEYDHEGWQRQEYISHEFYGVWGEFHVELTMPQRFTVGASGECVNPTEVGHGYDRIARGEKKGFVTPVDGEQMITWKFHAAPVHDFAWVADDDYVHEWDTWRDATTVHAFYKTNYARWWELKAIDYTKYSLTTYSDTFGPYPYRNFSTTMAGDGGMEYPELIMITGYRASPLSLAGVIAHEVGHQWFYGMLGSNETREAFMDEGFTSYATTIAMNAMFGDNQQVPGAEHSWLDWFIPTFSNKSGNYRGYQDIASQQYEEPLDIPHDWLREDATGGQVYGKTQAILNMLQYTLGDSVFGAGMKAYYSEWRFKHPHLIDFQKVMEKIAHTDLDWFFDEWFRSTRTVDYEAHAVKSIETASDVASNRFVNVIALHNNALAVMPIDVLLHYDDGTSEPATIPLVTNKGDEYHKSGVSRFLPGWDWTTPQYKGKFFTSKSVSWFEIDTSWRLQDLNWMNNYSDRAGLWSPPGEWALWKQLWINPPLDKYYAVVRPIIWPDEFSSLDAGLGIKYGMNESFNGDVKLIYKSRPGESIDFPHPDAAWYDHLDGTLIYNTPVDWVGRLGTFGIDAEKMYGIGSLRATLTKVIRPEYWRLGPTHTFSFYLEDQRLMSVDDYPVWHEGWGIRNYYDYGVPYGMHTQVAALKYSCVASGSDTRLDLLTEASLWGSDATFARAKGEYKTGITLPLDLNSKLRLTAGTATSGTPYQRLFWVGRADNYEEQSAGFFRAVSGIDRKTSKQTALFVEGGAGVRGTNDSTSDISGTQMLGASYDIAIPNPLASLGSFAASFSLGIFGDAGWVGTDWSDLTRDLRTDAGLKVTVNILSWLPNQLRGVAEEYDAIPTINFNMPLYVNHPTDGGKPFAWRYAISIGTAF